MTVIEILDACLFGLLLGGVAVFFGVMFRNIDSIFASSWHENSGFDGE